MARGLKIKVGADSAQFDRTMKNVRGKLDAIKGPIKAMGVAAAASTAAIVGSAAAVGALTYKVIKWGEAANTASARTLNAVKQMGLFGSNAEEVAARLDEVAKSTSLATGVDRKSIQMTQAKLATFKDLLETADESGGAFDRVTMAAINLAAAGFGSAESNAVALGKAFSDVEEGLTALKRSGTLTRQQIEEISQAFVQTGDKAAAFEKILQALETQSKSAAEATADGTVKIGNAFQILREEFGRGLAQEFGDAVNAIGPQMESAIQKAREFGDRMGKVIGQAIADAVYGDTEKLKAIGVFIGTVISEAAKAAGKIGLRGFGAQVLGGIQGAENFIRETTRLDKLIGKADIGTRAQDAAVIMASRDFDIAIKNATIALQEMTRITSQPGIGAGPVPAGFRLAGPDESSVFRDHLGRMVMKLDEISRNTRPQPFPAQ